MRNFGSESSELDQAREARAAHEAAKNRIRHRYNYIYDTFCGLTDDQLKAISLMLSTALFAGKPKEVVQQVHFYQGWVSGLIGSRSEVGEHLVYPDDIFPHFEEEEAAEFEARFSSEDSSSAASSTDTMGGYA